MSNRNTQIITEALERGLASDDEPMSPIARDDNQNKEENIVRKALAETSPNSEGKKDLDKQLADLALPGNPIRNLNVDFFLNINKATIEDEQVFPLKRTNKTLFKYLSEVNPNKTKSKSVPQGDSSSSDTSDDKPIKSKVNFFREEESSSSDLPSERLRKTKSSKEVFTSSTMPIITPSEKSIPRRLKTVPFESAYSNNFFSSDKIPSVSGESIPRRLKMVSSRKE